MSDYRVTLMSTLYKIYTTILAERIREEVEEKKIIPENQTGFRKGKGIIDNIYVLNYLVQKQINKEKRKLVSLFVDLKAAFDTVDREVLIRMLRDRGLREGLTERIEEILRETKSRVKIGEDERRILARKRIETRMPIKPNIIQFTGCRSRRNIEKRMLG